MSESPMAVVRAVLVAAPSVTAIVGDRIAAVVMTEGEKAPYVALNTVSLDPKNALDGWSGLDESDVEVDAWAESFQAADTLARTCRAALEAAGILCTGQVIPVFISEREPGLYRSGFFFQVWQ